nr:Tobramycin resistance predicted region [Klebsiella pneumoniae]WOF71971.1 Tobramycin resistance predicted region [Klebsiella pneumoniae]
MDRSLR